MTLASPDLPPVAVPVSDVLGPADYVIELEIARSIPEPELLKALERFGFTNVILDRAVKDEKTLHPTTGAVRFRFLGRVARAIHAVNTPLLQWIFVHRVPFDAYLDTTFSEPNTFAVGSELKSKRTYAFRFFGWMRQAQTRENICELLVEMGWRPFKILALNSGFRIPSRPMAKAARWYAIAEWAVEDSILTATDPFWFENLQEIGAP